MTSSSARAARISSGTGTELALSPTGGAASGPCGPPFAGGLLRAAVAAAAARRRRVLAVFRGRIGLCGWGVLAAQLRLERARDVVLRARVVAHVAREALDRVVVAVIRVGAVDAAVLPPVVDHLATAGRSGAGCGSGGDEQREERGQHQGCANGAPGRLVAGGGGQGSGGSRGCGPHAAGNVAESLGRR